MMLSDLKILVEYLIDDHGGASEVQFQGCNEWVGKIEVLAFDQDPNGRISQLTTKDDPKVLRFVGR